MTEPIYYDRLHDAIARAWDLQRQWAARGQKDSLCFVDLLERLERLEQANAQPTSNPSQIRNSLLSAVLEALCPMADPDDIALNWQNEALAMIYAVAAWFDDQAGGTRAAWMIREELKR